MMEFTLRFSAQGLRKKYQTLMNDVVAVRQIGESAIEHMEPYVPYATGQVRQSARITEIDGQNATIQYSANGPGAANFPEKSGGYVHYIHEGEVYGPNFQTKDGRWFSKAGQTKTPTGRDMEYHTSGTQGHWEEVLMPNGVERADWSKDARKILRDRWKELNG